MSGLRESWDVVHPHFWPFLGLHVLLALIGLLVTIPLAMVLVFGITALALAYAYRTLSGQEVVGSA